MSTLDTNVFHDIFGKMWKSWAAMAGCYVKSSDHQQFHTINFAVRILTTTTITGATASIVVSLRPFSQTLQSNVITENASRRRSSSCTSPPLRARALHSEPSLTQALKTAHQQLHYKLQPRARQVFFNSHNFLTRNPLLRARPAPPIPPNRPQAAVAPTKHPRLTAPHHDPEPQRRRARRRDPAPRHRQVPRREAGVGPGDRGATPGRAGPDAAGAAGLVGCAGARGGCSGIVIVRR